MSFRTQLRRLGEDLGDLLDRHEEASDLADFQEYGDDPVRFIREVLDGDPWERQEDVARTVLDRPLVVVRSANAVGKDWTAARLALWWVYSRQGLVLVTGPTERQVVEVVMGEVARAFGKAPDLPGELFQNSLRLGREEHAGILAFTSTSASKLTGFHAPRVMVLITEAQAVEGFAWEGLLACATGSEDRVLAVGNPLSPSGRFFTASRSDAWEALRIAADEHPNVQEGREVIPGCVTRPWIERMAAEWGEGSGQYRARVEGEFPDAGTEGLFRRSWLEEAADRWETGQLRVEAEEAEPIVAVDPARHGPDSTVVAVRRGPRLERLVAWGKRDTMETVSRIREVLEDEGVKRRRYAKHPRAGEPGIPARVRRYRQKKRWQPGEGDVVVDVVGVGGGVHDRLDELRYEVEDFNGGRSPRDKKRFLNARAESYWELKERLEAGEVALPRDEKLFDELVAIRWSPTAQGKVQIEAKDDLKGRLGRSPDRADAVSMAFYSRNVRGRGLRNLEPLKVG